MATIFGDVTGLQDSRSCLFISDWCCQLNCYNLFTEWQFCVGINFLWFQIWLQGQQVYLALADTCDHCVNETQNCETRDTSVIITFVLEPHDQTQPGSLSLSHSAGMGRTEPWERGWWRGGKRKESLQLRLWNLNICIEKVDAKCSLAEMTLVMTS